MAKKTLVMVRPGNGGGETPVLVEGDFDDDTLLKVAYRFVLRQREPSYDDLTRRARIPTDVQNVGENVARVMLSHIG